MLPLHQTLVCFHDVISVKYPGYRGRVREQTHNASGTSFILIPSLRIWILSLEFIACCRKSHSQGFFPKGIFMIPARLWELWSLASVWHSELRFSVSVVYTAAPEHVQECKLSSSPKLVIILSWSEDVLYSFNREILPCPLTPPQRTRTQTRHYPLEAHVTLKPYVRCLFSFLILSCATKAVGISFRLLTKAPSEEVNDEYVKPLKDFDPCLINKTLCLWVTVFIRSCKKASRDSKHLSWGMEATQDSGLMFLWFISNVFTHLTCVFRQTFFIFWLFSCMCVWAGMASSCNLTPFSSHDMSAHGACDVSMSDLSPPTS